MSFRQRVRDNISNRAATRARNILGIDKSNTPLVAFVLGSGLHNQVALDNERSVKLGDIPDFHHPPEHPTHPRTLCYGTRNGVPVLVQRGRFHIHETSPDPILPSSPLHWVRLQIDLLIALGAKVVILVSAVGSLNDDVFKHGDVVIINDFTTLYASSWPLFSGEHPQPTSALEDDLNKTALVSILRVSQERGASVDRSPSTRLVHIHGPAVETISDKRHLHQVHNAGVVGMSLTMDASVVALHRNDGVRALCVGVVSNNVTDAHDGGAVERCVHSNNEYIGAVLDKMLESISSAKT
jgi:purine nucleoside phosphorylase